MFPVYILMIENDDERIFAQGIYEQHKDIMYMAAYKILQNKEEAEDIVSICFIKVTDNIEYFMKKTLHELPGLLVSIVKNAAIDRYRQIRRVDLVTLYENDSDDLSDVVGNFVVDKDLHDRLYAALDILDQDYMTVLKLRLLHECTYNRIANLIGISEENVRKRYSRGKKILMEYLTGGN